MKKLIFVVIAVMVAGCSTVGPNQQSIEFRSDPPGATISSGSTVFGPAPVTRVWTLNDGQNSGVSQPIAATWVSGAKAITRMNLAGGHEGSFTFVRPANAPGLATDLSFAARLKQKEDAESSAAWAGIIQAYTDARYPAGGSPSGYDGLAVGASKNAQSNGGLSPLGYQTRDSFGNLVNSRDSFQTKDSIGNLVNSRDSFQTRDSFGNLVNSRACFQTKDSFGNLVMSGGC